MKFLDSTFLVDYVRGRSDVETYLTEHDDEEFVTSMINLKELAVGAHLLGDPTKEEFLANFGWITALPFDDDHAFHAARIEAELQDDSDVYQHEIDSLSGDILIAGVARSLGTPVVTKNVEDFERLDGVSVESY